MSPIFPKTGFLFILFWIVFSRLGISYSAVTPQSAVFLIQDIWGGIIGLSVEADGHATEPSWVRPIIGNKLFPIFIDLQADANGGYQLTSYGAIFPIGNAKLTTTFWTTIGEVNGFAVVPDGSGGWTATETHLTTIGRPPQLVLPAFYHAIMDLKYDSSTHQLMVLCKNGEIAVCGRTGYEWINRLQLPDDRAVDMDTNGTDFYVLTEKAKIYHINKEQADILPDTPNLGEGLVRDLKLSPFGKGLYVLDAFGVIHAWGGAPPVPTEPLSVDAATALEIITAPEIPRWYPFGWNTEVELIPSELNLDPNGAPKTLSLMIRAAENLAGFSAEIHYDPKLITIAPDKVAIGDWWGKTMREAQVAASVDPQNSVIFLQGGGTFYPFQGASGSGELAKIAIAAEKDMASATTLLEIFNFYFRDASPGNVYQAGHIVNSTTVTIRPSYPSLSAVWVIGGATKTSEKLLTKPGEIVQADLWVEEGGRIGQIIFDYRFPSNYMKFLGMICGAVWRDDYPIGPDFSLPAIVNRFGKANHQQIRTDRIGACRDESGAIVVMFLAVTARGEGSIDWESIQILDHAGHSLDFQFIQSKLPFLSR